MKSYEISKELLIKLTCPANQVYTILKDLENLRPVGFEESTADIVEKLNESA